MEPVVHLHPIQGKDRMVQKGNQFCVVGVSLKVEHDEKERFTHNCTFMFIIVYLTIMFGW